MHWKFWQRTRFEAPKFHWSVFVLGRRTRIVMQFLPPTHSLYCEPSVDDRFLDRDSMGARWCYVKRSDLTIGLDEKWQQYIRGMDIRTVQYFACRYTVLSVYVFFKDKKANIRYLTTNDLLYAHTPISHWVESPFRFQQPIKRQTESEVRLSTTQNRFQADIFRPAWKMVS